MAFDQSKQLFSDANNHLVGGVNSPVRAFKSVGGTPIFFESGEGAVVLSEDGDAYIDYVLSWGPLLLGHAHPKVVQAVCDAAAKGTSFGAPTARETELAKLVNTFYPSMEKVRFVNSGTEATMAAVRLARGATGRSLIVKCDGCYHGASDSLLVAAGSGAQTLGTPNSAGVLPEVAAKTIVVPYNDLSAMSTVFAEHGDDIAGLIIEPVAGNMGLIVPDASYISGLRELCDRHGALLIFDEVMCGFRVAQGGAQQLFNIVPDITCLGKVIGGGLPVAAYGGSATLMAHIAPEGSVYQAGTLSGNPLAMAAGITTLSLLSDSQAFKRVTESTTYLVEGIKAIIKVTNIPLCVQQCGSMWCLFFTPTLPQNLADVTHCDFNSFNIFYHKMLENGVYLAPSQYEANFMSLAHTEETLELTLRAISLSLEP
ncbi:MAG: glutamate-1-semialdehyde 2,1-aminomutase [bacterium]|nr:glutamate-1-semialdehyde 2,1-aminomutase [bacterium]